MKRTWLVIGFSVWSVFTLALLGWWVLFSVRQLGVLQTLNLESSSDFLRHQKMLMYEGLTLFFCLFVGAVALIYLFRRENKILRERKNFLSLFTHDLKTTISSLRLMLERLSLKVKEPALRKEVQEIQQIGTRLNLQLQNALQAVYETNRIYILEEVDFCKQVNYLRSLWPNLSFKMDDGLIVSADSQAVRSICTNLIQNALDHAQASEVVFKRDDSKPGFIGIVCLTPGGRKLPVSIEEFKNTKRAFQSVDGSGVGLKLTKDVMKKMGGFLDFSLCDEGSLKVSLYFKKEDHKKDHKKDNEKNGGAL